MAQRSRSAYTAKLFGIASLGLMALGPALAHVRVLAPVAGFALFSLGMLVGLTAFGLSILALAGTPGATERPERGNAVWGLVLGSLALMVVLTVVVTRGFRATPGNCASVGKCASAVTDSMYAVAYRPVEFIEEQSHEFSLINDISTDLEDPPAFFAATILEGDWSFPEASRERQRVAYPKVKTLYVGGNPVDNYPIVLAVAEKMGWILSIQRPDISVFEATAETDVFRFVDDITVRMRASPRCPVPADTRCKSTAVDIRSRSREGRSDFGKNAARIREFNQMVRAYTVEDAPVLEELDLAGR